MKGDTHYRMGNLVNGMRIFITAITRYAVKIKTHRRDQIARMNIPIVN